MTQVQILDKAVCVSLCGNDLEKAMNPQVDNQADWAV